LDLPRFGGHLTKQRNDIFDPNTVSSWKVRGKKVTGTNIERMASGRAPIGVDGRPVNLHINTGSLPSGIDRAAFDKWRAAYWQARAASFQ